MLYLGAIVFVLFPAFVVCKDYGKSLQFPNPWSSIFRPAGFENVNLLKPVPTHLSHSLYRGQGITFGWVYSYLYNGTVCETESAVVESGMVTNQCFTAISDQDSNSTLTVMVQCYGDYAITVFFNSTDCDPSTLWRYEYQNLNTCMLFNSSDTESKLYGVDAYQFMCVEDSNLPISDGDWVVFSSYAEENCTDLYSFSANLNDVCYQFQDQALLYSFPNATRFYADAGASDYSVHCSSSNNITADTHELLTVCTESTAEDDDNELVQVESWTASLYFSSGTIYPTSTPTSYPTAATNATVYPTNVPTSNPTPFPTKDPTTTPTAAPTLKITVQPSAVPTTDPAPLPTAAPSYPPTIVGTLVPTRAPSYMPTLFPTSGTFLTFTSNITLNGVSSPNLDSASQRAVVNTTAISMSIPYDQVSFVSAYSVSSTAASAVATTAVPVSAHTRGGKVHVMASSSIVAVTKVNTPLSNPSQSSAVYTQLTSALNNSVSTNQFSKTLQSVSKATGATQTMYANATDVSSSAATVTSSVDSTSSSSSSDNGLSGGAIAGIVIGGVAFVAIVVGVGYYLYFKSVTSSGPSNNNNVTSEAPAVNIMMKSNPSSSPTTEFDGVNPMQTSSSAHTPPVVAVAIEEGSLQNQTFKQLS